MLHCFPDTVSLCLCVARTSALSKLVSQIKFVSAALADALAKSVTFEDSYKDMRISKLHAKFGNRAILQTALLH